MYQRVSEGILNEMLFFAFLQFCRCPQLPLLMIDCAGVLWQNFGWPVMEAPWSLITQPCAFSSYSRVGRECRGRRLLWSQLDKAPWMLWSSMASQSKMQGERMKGIVIVGIIVIVGHPGRAWSISQTISQTTALLLLSRKDKSGGGCWLAKDSLVELLQWSLCSSPALPWRCHLVH